MLTAERLREVLDYDPETGVFIWKERKSYHGPVWPGKCAGGISDQGYRRIRVDKREYYSGRLAWLYIHGRWPDGEIDHINGVRDDDRLSNLRMANRSENCRNTRIKNNKSGLKGVHAYRSRFIAQIHANGKKLHLGVFDTPQEAHAAYCEAAREHHGEFARVR